MTERSLILVVDDDPIMCQIARAHLEGAGFDVETSGSAEDGLAKARELQPSLIILDFAMPGGSGGDVLRTIRRDGRIGSTPVLMVTAWSMDEAKMRTAGLPALWLQKPITGQTLLHGVNMALAA